MGKVFDVRAISHSAVLPVQSRIEIRALQLQPVNHWVSVFLDGCREDDELIPFLDLIIEIYPLAFCYMIKNQKLCS